MDPAKVAAYTQAFEAAKARRAKQIQGLDLAKAHLGIPHGNFNRKLKALEGIANYAMLQSVVAARGLPSDYYARLVSTDQPPGAPNSVQRAQSIYGS